MVHLHLHSNYSLKEGGSTVEDLVEQAASSGMQTLALTDHDGMYGAVRFTQACKAAGVRPILGAELEWGEGYHAVLLARNKKGWANLCRLVTSMHQSERAQSLPPGIRPRTSFEQIAEHSDGLLALSGCSKGEVNWFANLGQHESAIQAARRWLDVFGTENFALEASNHLTEDDPRRLRNTFEIASHLGIGTVATNNVHYARRADAAVHEVLDCIRRIVPLSRSTVPRCNSEFWLKDSNEMSELLPATAVAGSELFAERCTYELPMGEFHFPEVPASKGGPDAIRGESATSILARRCFDGLSRRFPSVSHRIDERLQMELRVIRKAGFCGYFLLVADIVEFAKQTLGLRCACRGSAAGSLVAYALGISDVDPIRHNLVFERFMNPYRREIPDIDIDFPSARRSEVNQYILDTYGDRTAMVAMMETFRARAALREVGKALGLFEAEIDAVAKAFPHISASAIPEAIEALPEVKELKLDSSRLENLFEIASRLDGYPRHLALHPSGVILSDETLKDLMPMQRSYEGFLVSQFDKDDVDALGVAKLDVLGIRMLSAMEHALDEVQRIHLHRPDLDEIALDDEATFELMRDSRTLGCFQIESPGQRELLGKFQPNRFEDLIIDISLFRPGPVKSDMVRPFLERRHGFEPMSYLHPALKPFLRETNGVIVYHEQVMRVISEMTGCDLAEADRIRRLLEDPESIEQMGIEVVAKALERGWKESSARLVWAAVAEFAAFGFCKAHAAAFSVPTYQSAWLKAHYPAEFYCGVLTHEPGMYPRRAILADARAHGVKIFGVDINDSGQPYLVESGPDMGGIRLGLMHVKGISESEVTSIIEGRPWRSFEDFCSRASVDRPSTEALVHVGAFDSLKGKRSRRELYWLTQEHWSVREKAPGDQPMLDLSYVEPLKLEGIDDYSLRQRVEAELEVLGLDASAHILDFYSRELARLNWTPARDLRKLKGGSYVVVAGVKVATQTPPIRSGRRVLFLTLEDGTGQADVTLFEEAQGKFARRVFDSWILAVRGKVRRTGRKGVSVLGEDVICLSGNSDEPSRKLWHKSGGSAGR